MDDWFEVVDWPVKEHTIDVWKSSLAEIRNIVQTTVQIPKFKIVKSQIAYPQTLYDEPLVRLASEPTYYCQNSFQLSHEFIHLICIHTQIDQPRLTKHHPNLWFEESICDLGSWFGLFNFWENWTFSEDEHRREYSVSFFRKRLTIQKALCHSIHAKYRKFHRTYR